MVEPEVADHLTVKDIHQDQVVQAVGQVRLVLHHQLTADQVAQVAEEETPKDLLQVVQEILHQFHLLKVIMAVQVLHHQQEIEDLPEVVVIQVLEVTVLFQKAVTEVQER